MQLHEQLTQTARAAQTHHPVKKDIYYSQDANKAQRTMALQLINFLVISVLREAHLHVSDCGMHGTVDGGRVA